MLNNIYYLERYI